MTEIRTYNAADIANYFRTLTDTEEGDLLTNLKLQKLCYYAQGIGIATRNVPLFSEQMEAWQHGPVVPVIYQEYREHGSTPISPPEGFDTSIFNKADLELMNDVYDEYGQYSAWKLRNMTHEEPPWINAYETSSKNIPLESLEEYFGQVVSDSYRAAYHAKIQETE